MTTGITGKEPDPRQVYADIIDLPHHESDHHPPMSLYDRAAQFSPFSSLPGYGDLIVEEARLVDRKTELSESEAEQLNQKLKRISAAVKGGVGPVVEITRFVPDPLKAGGKYETITERIRKVDPVARKVILERRAGPAGSRMEIRMEDILDLRGEGL